MMKKKGLLVFILVTAFSLFFVACANNTGEAPTINIDQAAITMNLGDPDVTLTYKIEPEGDWTVEWSSDNTGVATVSNGVVKAVAPGTANITAKVKGYDDATDTVRVTVIKPVTSITLNKTTLQLTLGGATETLTATVAPDDATNKKVMWRSDDETIATVSNGEVTPVGVGTTTIKAISQSNQNVFAECTVTVSRPNVTALAAAPTFGQIPLESEQLFTVSPTPAEADATVTWAITSQTPETGYTAVIEATSTPGVFKAVGLGSAKLQATSTIVPTVKSNEVTVSVIQKGRRPSIAVSTPADFEQIYLNPNYNYYMTQDIDFGGKVFYGAQTFMIVDKGYNAGTDTFTQPQNLADRFVDGNNNPVKHFIDRGVTAYDETTEALKQRFFAPYDPASSDPKVSARYLILNEAGTEYVPIAQHDLFKDASGTLEVPGENAGGKLREPFKDYKRVMVAVDNPVGTSGDTRVFHLRGAINAYDVFGDGILRHYQAPVVTFNGIFDGRGYALKNFKLGIAEKSAALSLGSARWSKDGVTDPWGQSMFGNIGFNGIVRNIVFDSVTVDAHGQGGIIAAQNNGIIENIHFTNIKEFRDISNAGGDANCGTGFILGVNNPTGRIFNILYDGTGDTSDIGGTANNAYSVYPIAVANRAWKSSNAIKNIYIVADRFASYVSGTTRNFIGTSNRSDTPSFTVENGGYNPTAADDNANLFMLSEKGTISFEALPSDIWDKTGEWPTLKKQTGNPLLVGYTDDMLNGSRGFVAYGLPIAATGFDYTFKLNVLKTHKVDGQLKVNYSIAGGAQNQEVVGVASAPLSDYSVDYTFTIPNVTGDVTFNSITGISAREEYNVTTPTIDQGLALTDEFGLTVTSLPKALAAQNYKFGIYTQLPEGKGAKLSVKYSVAGGVTDQTLLVDSIESFAGGYTYWYFVVPAENVTGAITFTEIKAETADPVTVDRSAITMPTGYSWRTSTGPGNDGSGTPPATATPGMNYYFAVRVSSNYPAAGKTISFNITINGVSKTLLPTNFPTNTSGNRTYYFTINGAEIQGNIVFVSISTNTDIPS